MFPLLLGSERGKVAFLMRVAARRCARLRQAVGTAMDGYHDRDAHRSMTASPRDTVLDASAALLADVIIATDVRLYGDGLAHALRADGRLAVIGSASSTAAAFAMAHALRPGVMLLDAAMPGALAGLRATRAELPALRVVAFAVSDAAEDVLACVEAGAAAYLSRAGTVDDLVTTVARVTRGEAHCEPRVTAALFRRLADLADAAEPAPAHDAAFLTGREIEIVALIDEGLTNKAIAARLRICPATVKNHVHNILEKLHVRRRAEAASQLRNASRQ